MKPAWLTFLWYSRYTKRSRRIRNPFMNNERRSECRQQEWLHMLLRTFFTGTAGRVSSTLSLLCFLIIFVLRMSFRQGMYTSYTWLMIFLEIPPRDAFRSASCSREWLLCFSRIILSPSLSASSHFNRNLYTLQVCLRSVNSKCIVCEDDDEV